NLDDAALLGQPREREERRDLAARRQVEEPTAELLIGERVARLDREVPGGSSERDAAHRKRDRALGGGERGIRERGVGAVPRRERHQIDARPIPRARGGGEPGRTRGKCVTARGGRARRARARARRARETRALEIGDPEQLAIER